MSPAAPAPGPASEPTAVSIIAAVEELLTHERSSSTRHRYARARERLEAFLEGLGQDMLVDSGIAMLEVERSIEPTGALLRVATAEDLLYALPAFIRLDRPGLPTSDAFAQLRFAEQCRRFIGRRRLVDEHEHMCAVWEIDGALRRTRRALRSG